MIFAVPLQLSHPDSVSLFNRQSMYTGTTSRTTTMHKFILETSRSIRVREKSFIALGAEGKDKENLVRRSWGRRIICKNLSTKTLSHAVSLLGPSHFVITQYT
ncbi:hypothetical protein VTL71DRAFT_4817 [Oculimacula yallundae]|uniref:Uncharacterized protein n=1 Tax=Oculimacula yallundae TaxID=86028 RepID=A0ABR4C357_9HELO